MKNCIKKFNLPDPLTIFGKTGLSWAGAGFSVANKHQSFCKNSIIVRLKSYVSHLHFFLQAHFRHAYKILAFISKYFVLIKHT